MSIINAVKTFFTVASVIEPHIIKIMDYQKALTAAQAQTQRLKEENDSLRTQITVYAILAAVFFIISIVLLVLLMSK
jgi:phage terminase Nu1 subunit (DNA packaging protein)